MDFESFRREYSAGGLNRDMLDACPVRQFEVWMEQALASEMIDPTAMVLSTYAEASGPTQRIVLFKGFVDGGFAFYTNYNSNKGKAIAESARVSLLFPWNALDRQVIVSGRAVKVNPEVSRRYFASRPRESQIVACASLQSQQVESRSALEQAAANLRQAYEGREIPRPEHWGGFQVKPERMEFWQGGEHRLHDRFVYTLDGDANWSIKQLQP
ncbi:MAG: pyridoxamine 5'-phosphate oxidase [Pseudomonadota bacterium]